MRNLILPEMSYGFKHNGADKCVYTKFAENYSTVFCLYVDDMLILGKNMNEVNETKDFLKSQFKMKDLGEVDTILGIKILRNIGEFTLIQSHYIHKMLEKFKHLMIKEANTPYDPSFKLFKNEGISTPYDPSCKLFKNEGISNSR